MPRGCVSPTSPAGHAAHRGGATMGEAGSGGGWRSASGCRATRCPVLCRTSVPVSLTLPSPKDIGPGATVGPVVALATYSGASARLKRRWKPESSWRGMGSA